MSNVEAGSAIAGEDIKWSHEGAERAIQSAKMAVDSAHPGPSREKALVHTKLDEALLWLSRVTAVALFVVVSSCATLSDLASTDWHAVMDDAHNAYAAVAGPLFTLCSGLEDGHPLDGPCAVLGVIDVAAQGLLVTADLAVETGEDVADRVHQAQAQVDKLTAAFEALQKQKSHVTPLAISAELRSKTAVRNPYRERAQLLRGALLFPANPYVAPVPAVVTP